MLVPSIPSRLENQGLCFGFQSTGCCPSEKGIWATSRQHWASGFDKKTPSVVET
jgi:hypothetical protein